MRGRTGDPPPAALPSHQPEAAGDRPAWSSALVAAESSLARGDAAAAVAVLSAEVARLRAAATATQRLLATTLGHLSRAEAARGQPREALAATTSALEIWQADGDRTGVLVALCNAVELAGRIGDGSAAAPYARRLASELGQEGDTAGALRYGALARALLRRGERGVRR